MQVIQGSKLALIGAALLALTLGGCGRKSGLDLPPQAAVQPAPGEAAGAPAPPRSNPFGLFDPVGEDEKPEAVPGQKRRIFLDKILD